MKYWLIGSVAAVALLGACGGSSGSSDAGAAAQTITVGDVKVEGLTLRSGDAAQAGAALTAMSLDDGDGRLSFADKSTDGANATFNSVKISFDGEESPISAGKLDFKGLDMTDEGATFAQMTLSDIGIALPDDEGELNVSSIQLTNPSPALSAWVGGLLGEGNPAAFPSFDQISFDGLSLNGMSVPADIAEELEAFDIGMIDVRNFSMGGIGSVVLEGFNLAAVDDGSDVNFSVDSLAMTGVTETVMEIFAVGFAEGAAGSDFEDVIEKISAMAYENPGDPGYDNFTMSNFAFDAVGIGFDMPSLDMAVTRDKQDRATRSVVKPYKFSVSADPEGEAGAQLAGPLAMMGYETLNFSGEGDARVDPDTDTYSYDSKSNWLALEDGFKLSYGLTGSGLSEFYKGLSQAGEDPDAMLASLATLSMQNFDLHFEDNSIVEKAFSTIGAMTGEDPAGVRSQAIAGVAFLPLAAGQVGVDAGLAAELGGALSKFLNESGTLSLSFDPATPVTAADFEDPTGLTKDRLGFKATVK